MSSSPVIRTGLPSGSIMAKLDQPTSTDPIRLAVVADPHLAIEAEGTSKLFEHTETHFRQAIADIQNRNVDAVLSPGDLSKDGERKNFDRVDEIIDSLQVPFYSVPGNHDVPKEGEEHDQLSISEFGSRYTPDGLPFRIEFGDISIFGLNSSGSKNHLFDSHDGEVPPDQLTWLKEELSSATNPIVLVHHNLPVMSNQLKDHRDAVEPDMEIPPIMRNPEPFVDVLSEHDVPLLLTGHLHLPSAAQQNGTREIMAPTTCSFPQGYLLIDITDEKTTIRFIPIADHEGMLRAYDKRWRDTITSRGLTSMAAVRLANFPLIDDGNA